MTKDNYPRELYRSPTYITWRAMIDRCNPKTKYPISQEYYVSKGITVCDEWKKFSGFLRDMGVRPDGATIDRIDNSKGYFKGNCRWASRSGQNKNRRTVSSSGYKYIYKHVDTGFNILVNPFKSFYSRSVGEALKKREELLELKNHINFKGDTMLFDSITFTARKNLGNYEHEELSVTSHVEEGEDVYTAIKELKVLVKSSLNGEVVAAQKVEAPKNKTEPKGEVKVPKEKPLKEVKKEEVVEEAPAAPSEEVKEEPKKEEPKKEEKAKAPKKETEPKKIKSKATAYDRNLDTHKALLGIFLDKEFPDWRKPEVLKKAGVASRGLQGKDFQDGEGNILDTFKDEFRTYMA